MREILTIRLDNYQSTDKAKLEEKSTGSLNSTLPKAPKENISNGKLAAAKIGGFAVATVSAMAINQVKHEINAIGSIYGDQASQNRINNVLSIGGDAVSGIFMIGLGAKLGAVGGPVGIAIGATVGLIAAAGLKFQSMMNEMEMINNELMLENRQNEKNAERLGMMSANGFR